MKNNFTNAIVEAMEQLERRGYDSGKAIAYTHPTAYKEAIEKTDYLPDEEVLQICGITVERTPNVPTDVVVAVHLNAMRLGANAVAFSKVEE